jgi:hypothetical protein
MGVINEEWFKTDSFETWKNEEWIDTLSIFNDISKTNIKLAKLAEHDGFIETKYGNLSYNKNDYIIRHGANNYEIVKTMIFFQTYAISF